MRLNFWKKEFAVDSGTPEFISVSEYISDSSNKNTIYNTLVYWILMVGVGGFLLFFTPWGTGPLEQNKELFLILFSGTALVLWLIDVVSSGYFKWRTNEFIKPIGAILSIALLASLFSLTKFKSLYGMTGSLSDSLVVVFSLSVLSFLIVNVFEDKGKEIQKLLALSLCAVFAYGVLQIFGLHLLRFDVTKSRAFNTVGSLNSLGLLAAVSLPFLHKSYFSVRWFKNYLLKVSLGLAIFILVVLNWWVLWTVAIVGMFALVSFESLNSRAFKISKSLIPLIIIVLGVFLMAVNFNLPIKNKLPLEIAPSHQLSLKVAGSVLKDRFIFGYGPENFSPAFDRYGSPEIANTTFSTAKFYDATSEFYNSLIHGGIVLASGFIFLIYFVSWEVFKFYKNTPSSEDGLVHGVIAMATALTAGFFLYPFNISLMFMFYLALAMIGLILWGGDKSSFSIEKSPILSLISSLGFIGGLVLVLITTYFGLLFYFADVKYAKALKESDLQKSADILTESVKWNNNDDRYYRSLSQISLNLLAEEIKKPNDDPAKSKNVQNYITSSVNFAKKAVDIDSKEASNWANLGNVYRNLIFVVDNVDKLAEDAYTKAAELRAGDATYYNQIGTLYLAKGDRLLQQNSPNNNKLNQESAEVYKKSEAALKKALEISDNYGLAIYNLGTVYDRQGKIKEAIKELEKIAPFNSNQAGLMFELGLLYYRDGRKDKAFEQLQRAIVLAPDYANARWYLASIYEERGDLNSAMEQLEKILSVELNKHNSVVKSRLEDLRSGKKSIPPSNVLDRSPL